MTDEDIEDIEDSPDAEQEQLVEEVVDQATAAAPSLNFRLRSRR
jgi:hypothetical protein